MELMLQVCLGSAPELFIGRPEANTTKGGPPMVANSLFLTIAILLTFGFWLLGELKFFIPYKAVLFHEYGTVILVYLATLFLNLFAAAFALNRKFFLKDTGRKLSHLDKQLHVGQTEVRAPSLEEEVD
jgi:Na+/phosphate symporter